MKKETMNEILNYVKEDCKELVMNEVENIVNSFSKLTEDEKEDVYCTSGTIEYLFDNINFEVEEVLINKENDFEFVDLILDNLN
jgi:hypothetical protein